MRDLNPNHDICDNIHKGDTFDPESQQTRTESGPPHGAPDLTDDTFTTPSEHSPDPSLRQKCALFVHWNSGDIPSNLAFVIRVWPDLNDEAKEKIIAIITKEQ